MLISFSLGLIIGIILALTGAGGGILAVPFVEGEILVARQGRIEFEYGATDV
ncbi:MAG: hypothetical protein ACHP7O_09865 [Burkholderiales bacterium]